MAKRKRRSFTNKAGTSFDGSIDPKASKLHFNSYEDLPDSEDEFHINRDKISFKDGPEAKRRRGYKELDIIELSDEEVLRYEDGNSSEDDYEGSISASADPQDVDEEDDNEAWGTSKEDYYSTDKIETGQDALDEEAEALRIQRKRLKSLKSADFAFDPLEWSEIREEGGQMYKTDGEVITEVLPQIQVTDQMSTQERIDLFKTQYPEVEYLAADLVALHDVHEELESLMKKSNHASKREMAAAKQKHRALSGYLSSLAMYFAILTSPAQGDEAKAVALPPQELREHEVMDSIVRSRELWTFAEAVEDPSPSLSPELDDHDFEAAANKQRLSHKKKEEDALSKANKKSSKNNPTARTLEASRLRREERLRRTEQSLASISKLPFIPASKSVSHKGKFVTGDYGQAEGEDSDLGDEQNVTVQEAAEKAQRRKSLRFYTSQIAQKANKRARAGRAAGGDDDIPYRERLRDRQERLIREAENRGKKSKSNDPEADFDEDNDVGETERTNLDREYEEDEYLIERGALAKKEAKREREEAYQKAKGTGGVVVRHVDDEVGPDGRREVGYVIKKNKGLAPRRKKEVKNPRVKKRKRFDDKMKKLRSMKQVYKGGEGKGGYRGELSGIKSRLVRSVKLS